MPPVTANFGNDAVPPRAGAPVSRRLAFAAIAVLVAVLGVVLFCFDPSHHGFYPGCIFYQTTGLLCAGCGATRALYQLLHGNLVMAFRFNPILVISIPFLLWFLAGQVLRVARKQSCAVNIRPRWLWLIFAVLVIFSVVRNLPGLPTALRMPDNSETSGLHDNP